MLLANWKPAEGQSVGWSKALEMIVFFEGGKGVGRGSLIKAKAVMLHSWNMVDGDPGW